MPAHQTEIFIYDNIYFENGRKDQNEHPVIIAGTDEDNVYAFAMTSQVKHVGKNSITRNQYNETIKYAESIPGRNCTTNNYIRGLVNTSNCIIIPLEQAKKYPKFGIASQKLLEEIIAKWAFHQNVIMEKKDFYYKKICDALGITDSIKMHPVYRNCQYFAQNNPDEIALQTKYYADLKKYREECLKVRRENINRYYRGESHLPYPKEPRLQDDKSLYERYLPAQPTEEEKLANSPFAGLADQLFGRTNPSPSNTIEFKPRNEPYNRPDSNISDRKKELLELKQMIQDSQSQPYSHTNEQESSHGRRAA